MGDAYQIESLYTDSGERKYLLPQERRRLLTQSLSADNKTRAFIRVMVYTGARVSEALAVRRCDVLNVDGYPKIRLRTLKKKKGAPPLYRLVPVPNDLVLSLADTFDIGLPETNTPKDPGKNASRLWTFTRQTAWKRTKDLMMACGIEGVRASPKGLRHGFAVGHVLADPPVPATQLSAWLGHSNPNSTRIYYTLIGREDHELAASSWQALQ